MQAQRNYVGTGSAMAMIPITCCVVGEEKENEQPVRIQPQHETILTPVGDASDVDQTTFEDGATADVPGIIPPGSSAVAVDRGRVPIDAGVLEPNAGDTTEDTDEELAVDLDGQLPLLATAVYNRLAVVEALPAELPRDDNAVDLETRTVDLGWGIVVGELSHEEFKEVMSFPKL